MLKELKVRVKSLGEIDFFQRQKEYLLFEGVQNIRLHKNLWYLLGQEIIVEDHDVNNYYILKTNDDSYGMPKMICEVLEEKVSSTPTINNDSECDCCKDCDLDLDTQYVIDKASVRAYEDFTEVLEKINDENKDAENIQFAVSYAEKMIILCENFLDGMDCNEECKCEK